MTEQDIKDIYEWADGAKVEKHLGAWCGEFIDEYDRKVWLECRVLDMNFAHGTCIPKLVSEGIGVQFVSGVWYFDAPDKDAIYTSPDFYKNLLAYIRGVK